jgi:hypothetical protein
VPVIPATWKAEIGGLRFEASLGKKQKTLSEKQLKQKGLGDVDLSSNPSTTGQERRKEKKMKENLGADKSKNVRQPSQ